MKMKFYYVSIQCAFSHTMTQYPDQFGPFLTEKEARDTWEGYKERLTHLGPSAVLKTVEIELEEIILTLLKENFLAFHEMLKKAKIEDTNLL